MKLKIIMYIAGGIVLLGILAFAYSKIFPGKEEVVYDPKNTPWGKQMLQENAEKDTIIAHEKIRNDSLTSALIRASDSKIDFAKQMLNKIAELSKRQAAAHEKINLITDDNELENFTNNLFILRHPELTQFSPRRLNKTIPTHKGN